MHELRIAENIIDAVVSEMERRGLKRVQAVGVRIGELTDIVPDSLQFGFNALVADTPLAGAALDIERLPVKARCRECQLEFEVKNLQFLCSGCGGRSIETVQGQELDICYLEVEEPTVDQERAAAQWPE